MNMRKTLPLLVIASMMLSLIPSMMVSAALASSLSVSSGYVGTVVTVFGTLNTYNGRFQVQIDADNSGAFGNIAAEDLAGFTSTLRANGNSYSADITIPDSYEGARKIRVTDLDAAGTPTVDAFFTIITKFTLAVTNSIIVEGGPATVTATVTGGKQTWTGTLDLRFRFKDTTGTDLGVGAPYTQAFANLVEAAPGKFTQAATIVANDPLLVTWGAYSAVYDWDDVLVPTWPGAQQSVATKSFTVRMTDKAEYERTNTPVYKANVPNGKTLDKVVLVAPDGSATTVFGPALGIVGGAAVFHGGALPATTKTSAMGLYTLKLYDLGGSIYKTQTYTLIKAGIVATLVAAPGADFSESTTLPAAVTTNIVASNQAVERMHTVKAVWTLTYPDGSPASSADVPAGFSVSVFYNNTLAGTIVLDPLTAYTAPNLWSSSWKIPKDAVKGKNYMFNVTANVIVDNNGNSGPTKNYGSKSIAVGGNPLYFTVASGKLFITAGPTLNYPGAGANLARTSDAKATFELRYADNSRVAAADMQWVNTTVTCGASTYTINVPAGDYNADVGLWIPKWNVAYNAPIAAATFSIGVNKMKDNFGNNGPAVAPAASAAFNVIAATVAVSDVTVDKTSVQSDEQITVSFKATYPSGANVATKNATGPFVTFYDNSGTAIVSKRASYSATTGKWSVSWIVPTGSTSGTYNATINVNNVQDDAAVVNKGPTVKKYANFDVSRVSLTEVLAASNAAEASADLAQTKADAAKVAANTAATKADAAATAATAAQTAATSAGTKADAAAAAATAAGTAANAAKTSADAATAAATSAGTKADAAKTAADGAKTAADSAAAAANGLTTLVYAAIGASLIAALAAIVALMQISRKIA